MKYKKREKPLQIINHENILCSYGCGNIATHQGKCGKYICNESINKCSEQIRKQKLIKKNKTPEEKILEYKTRKGRKQSLNERLKRKGPRHSKEYKERLRNEMLNGKAIYLNRFIKNPSKLEVKLRELIKILYSNCEFQYPVLNYSLDVALPDKKIAIEYDGWYHFDTQDHIDYHFRRQKKIEEQGWKFIRYSMFNKFPSIEQIRDSVKTIIEQEEKS